MERLQRWSGYLDHGLVLVASLMALLMMGQVTFDIALRYLFGHQLQGTIEVVSAYYMVAVVFLPLAYVERTGGHIRADVLARLLPPNLQSVMRLAAHIIVLATLATISWFTLQEAIGKTIEGELWRSGEHLIPVWPSRWLLPIGSTAMALSLLLKLFAPGSLDDVGDH